MTTQKLKPAIQTLEGQLTVLATGSYGILVFVAALLDFFTKQPILSHYAHYFSEGGALVTALIAWLTTHRTALKMVLAKYNPTSVAPAATVTGVQPANPDLSSGVTKLG